MPVRKASAVWNGGLKSGNGEFTGVTGAVSGRYTAGSRFQEEQGSNPEELLAAAAAACFSMALSGALERNNMTPERIETRAECAIEKIGEGWKITTMKFDTTARVSNVDEAAFMRIAQETKDGCPVSTALKGNVKIELEARLER
jgi:lipoyl-dependent peroxiredoxin